MTLPALESSLLTSPLLVKAGFAHAFFTRHGGVSRPPFESLSFSTATGDSPANVAENRARAAAALGIEEPHLYYLCQVHGVGVRVLSGRESPDEVLRWEGDITASRTPGVGCGVRVADCAPVLLAHAASGAVAAVHSGWRGTVRGAVGAGVAALRELAGPGEVLAAVGPHIEPCCFEVGEDVAAEIASSSPLGERVVDRSRPPRPHVDLRAIIAEQLERAGVDDVDHVRGCTVCDSARFHSYRRDGKVSGRMLAAVVAREPRRV